MTKKKNVDGVTVVQSQLSLLGACEGARNEFYLAKCATIEQAWEHCVRKHKAEWMIWFVIKCGIGPEGSLTRRRLVALAMSHFSATWFLRCGYSDEEYEEFAAMARIYVSGGKPPDKFFSHVLMYTSPYLVEVVVMSADTAATRASSISFQLGALSAGDIKKHIPIPKLPDRCVMPWHNY